MILKNYVLQIVVFQLQDGNIEFNPPQKYESSAIVSDGHYKVKENNKIIEPDIHITGIPRNTYIEYSLLRHDLVDHGVFIEPAFGIYNFTPELLSPFSIKHIDEYDLKIYLKAINEQGRHNTINYPTFLLKYKGRW